MNRLLSIVMFSLVMSPKAIASKKTHSFVTPEIVEQRITSIDERCPIDDPLGPCATYEVTIENRNLSQVIVEMKCEGLENSWMETDPITVWPRTRLEILVSFDFPVSEHPCKISSSKVVQDKKR